MTNKSMLAKLDSAIKGITEVSTLGTSILQPTKFASFVKKMQHSTTILPAARFMMMEAQIADIDLIGFTGRVLRAGNSAAAGGGTVVELSASTHGVSPTPATNQLVAKELVGITSLRDTALRRNIEGSNFEDTLLDLFSSAAGRDLEELCVLGDTNVAYGSDNFLCQTNGWVSKSNNKVYGAGAGKDFDPSATNYPENMFDTMLAALPKQYFKNVNDWEFHVTWEMFNAYQNLLKARGTSLGDTAQTGAPQLYYKGVAVKYTPVLERAGTSASSSDGYMDGDIAMLQNPDNMVYGVFHQVQLEPEREAKARRTDFVLTFEGDCHYEDTDASVVALVDKEV